MMSTKTAPDLSRSLEFEWAKYEEHKLPPNHLADTNIFSRLQGNNFVQAEPAELHFHIKSTNGVSITTYKKQFRIINVSQRSTRVNFIPPETEWFKLFYSAPKPFVPGSAISCTVHFKPDETRHYEDLIRVHTEDCDNHLLVPIYAYPVAQGLKFPEYVRLPAVPLGETVTRKICLRYKGNANFDFFLKKIRDHPSFKVTPVAGRIQPGEKPTISIQFTPTCYTTCRLDLELHVSQMNFTPQRCSIIGWSQPGIESNKYKESFVTKYNRNDAQDAALFDLHPLDRTRRAKFQQKMNKSQASIKGVQDNQLSDEIEKEQNITCPHHVAKLLLKDGRNIVEENLTFLRRQKKVLAFEAMVRQDAMAERRNQVRWQAKLGEQPLPQANRLKIRNAFEDARQRYLEQCTSPESLREKKCMSTIPMKDSSTMVTQERPHRPATSLSALKSVTPTFRIQRLPVNGWAKRWAELDRFRQIVSRVIFRQRAANRLKMLKRLTKDKVVDDQQDSYLAKDILDRIARPISVENLLTVNRQLPDCWMEPFNHQTTVNNDAVNTCDPQNQPAIDGMELTSAFVTPSHRWSVFEIPSAWEWELTGCEQFDPWEARDLAQIALEQSEVEAQSILSVLESREDPMGIVLKNKQCSVDDPMLSTKAVLQPPKTGTERESPSTNLNMIITFNPNTLPDPVSKHVEECLRLPRATWMEYESRSSVLFPDSNDLGKVMPTADNKAGRVSKNMTTLSPKYKTMVPLPSVKDALLEDHVQTQAVLTEVHAAEKLLADNEVSVDITDESVANLMKEWIEKFPELATIAEPWLPKTESIEVGTKLKSSQASQAAGQVEALPEREPSSTSLAYCQLMRTAQTVNEEILALCDKATLNQG